MPHAPPPADTPSEVRDGFKFRSGHLALDLGATLAQRAQPAPRELLHSPDDVARWLVAAELSQERLVVTIPDVLEARALREALYRLALATSCSEVLQAEDRALVNRWAAKPAAAPQLSDTVNSELVLAWTHGTTRGFLAAIARDGITLLAGPLASRIRKCDGCTLLFVDLSRSGSRRWCSMSACGNKAKVAAFRQRAVEPPPTASKRKRTKRDER
ncbi:MAG: ABATE domain-containing protein [bacterium]